MPTPPLSTGSVSRIIEMAWADDIAFEAIGHQFGLNESAVVRLMRRHLKPSSFRRWRQRVAGRTTKYGRLSAQASLPPRLAHGPSLVAPDDAAL